MHQVLRRYWAGKTDVVRLEADAAHQKKLFFLLMDGVLVSWVPTTRVGSVRAYDMSSLEDKS
jgi:hypothetical protein